MPETTSSVTESLKAGNRVVAFGIAAIVLILLAAALFLFLNLPDANAFNARVERLFVENDARLFSAADALACASHARKRPQGARQRAAETEKATEGPARSPRAAPPRPPRPIAKALRLVSTV